MKLFCKVELNKTSKKKFLEEYLSTKYKQPNTYFVENKVMQCDGNRNRSIGDLQALLNGTFKTRTSIRKTAKLLVELVDEKKIKTLYCPHIKKIVFCHVGKPYVGYTIAEASSFTGGGIVGKDGYNWKALVDMYNSYNHDQI
jgi:hypothetical protein